MTPAGPTQLTRLTGSIMYIDIRHRLIDFRSLYIIKVSVPARLIITRGLVWTHRHATTHTHTQVENAHGLMGDKGSVIK